MNPMKNKILKFGLAIVICELAGVLGSIFTVGSVDGWYLTLAKPSFNPPSWVFGPVWTTLYALMGVSLFLVWDSKSKSRRHAVEIFGAQLVLNVCWSVIFFGLHQAAWAFVEILFLWCAIVATIWAFYKIRPAASYLLVPYLAWVSFAAVLSYSIWQLNS